MRRLHTKERNLVFSFCAESMIKVFPKERSPQIRKGTFGPLARHKLFSAMGKWNAKEKHGKIVLILWEPTENFAIPT